jgi:hypothetical protein
LNLQLYFSAKADRREPKGAQKTLENRADFAFGE